MEVISPVHGKITYDENEIIKFEKTIYRCYNNS